MAEPTFEGVGIALLTQFTQDGAVDVAGTIDHARRLTDAGARSILVAGTTGEAETLDDDERVALIAAAREGLPDDVTVIAGASGSWPRGLAARAAAARKAGADAVLVSPSRGGISQVDVFGAASEAVGGAERLIGYHNPGPLGVPGIEVDSLSKLPFGAIKDSSADPVRLLQELASWDGRIYVGSAALLALAGPLGATGALLAFANVEPETCIKAWDGDAKAQRSLTDIMLAVRKHGLRALKEATAEKYGTSPVCRLGLR